ncbi:MAG: hypothetical protein IAG10_24535, partial [Planctomycetaceae bacterium]|nr:hypothetical protein [Planctomycetaceae bacterium]
MKKRWWVVATLLIACLIVTAWVLLQEPKGPEVTLSDGSIVRFEKAGVGTFPYDSYPPLKASLAGFVPNRFQSRLGERIKTTFSSQPNAVGLLFSIWTAEGKRHRDLSRFLSRVEFVESTGFVFKVGVSGASWSNNNMMCFSEGPFPRRDPTLHMRFYEQGTERLLFDLHVPNPGYKSTFSEWTPETVPASQTVAPLTATLKNGPANLTEKYLREQDLEI